MTRPLKILVLVLALAVVGAACGDSGDDAPATGTGRPTAAPATTAAPTTTADAPTTTMAPEDPVSLIYVSPNPLGVNNFLILGEVGTQLGSPSGAAVHRLCPQEPIVRKTFESVDDSTRRANIEAAIDEAPDVIVLTTFTLVEMADEYCGQGQPRPRSSSSSTLARTSRRPTCTAESSASTKAPSCSE